MFFGLTQANGAPRKNGSTASLIKAFTKGAISSGNEVREAYIHGMDVKNCLGCDACMKTHAGCVQKDEGMTFLDQRIPLVRQETANSEFSGKVGKFIVGLQCRLGRSKAKMKMGSELLRVEDDCSRQRFRLPSDYDSQQI